MSCQYSEKANRLQSEAAQLRADVESLEQKRVDGLCRLLLLSQDMTNSYNRQSVSRYAGSGKDQVGERQRPALDPNRALAG